MASIRRQIVLDAPPQEVWEALRDWGALHTRLAPGFVLDAELDGADRIVTFFNGSKVRELLVSSDDELRRLVWTVREGSLGFEHYNGAAEVFAEGESGSRFVWTVDLLPDDLEPTVSGLVERGLATIKTTLESRPARA